MGDVLPPPAPRPAGTWAADPWGRHQLRWFDGSQWTSHVCDNGVLAEDIGAHPPAPEQVRAVPTLPHQPTASSMHHAQAAQHAPLGRGPATGTRLRRRGATVVKVGAAAVVGLLVATAVIALADQDADNEAGANPSGDRFAALASAVNVVPVQLGPEATHRERPVDATSFGDDWPLTVDSGIVVCEAVPAPLEMLYVLFVDPVGSVYAVNGTARGVLGSQPGWLDFETIWKDHPDEYVPKVNIGPLIEAGLEICEPAPITDASVSDVFEPDTIEGIVQIVWDMATPEERQAMCDGWRASPDVMREVYISEAGAGDPAYWPPLEARLQQHC